jgi:hypothetical protein
MSQDPCPATHTLDFNEINRGVGETAWVSESSAGAEGGESGSETLCSELESNSMRHAKDRFACRDKPRLPEDLRQEILDGKLHRESAPIQDVSVLRFVA